MVLLSNFAHISLPPELQSKYLDFLRTLQEAESKRVAAGALEQDGGKKGRDKKESRDEKKKASEYFHAWIYVDISHLTPDSEGQGFFIESTTGERKRLSDPAYKRINAVWNHENYWLSKTGQDVSTTPGTQFSWH